MSVWVREAPTRAAYQKRLAIWITATQAFHAARVAEMICASTQAVWLWIGEYNRQGPEGLDRRGRGGRRWAFLSWPQEQTLLSSFEKRAAQGEILTAKQLRKQIECSVGREVSLAYVYRLLRRHNWRKIGPRPRHVNGDHADQEAFKKNSPG
jgi:transposase